MSEFAENGGTSYINVPPEHKAGDLMDIVGAIYRINSLGKYLVMAILIINLVTFASAKLGSVIPGPGSTIVIPGPGGGGGTGGGGEAGSGIQGGLISLCTTSQMLLGVVVMVLIVLAGVIYAAGQVLGAETRARAAVWATAMLTGAVIGGVIYLVAPVVLHVMIPNITPDPSNPCGTVAKTP